MKRWLLGGVICGLLGVTLAQTLIPTAPFTPPALPETIMPSPIPEGMATLPSNMTFTRPGQACGPVVTGIPIPTQVFDSPQDAEASKLISSIVDADQAVRQKDWSSFTQADFERIEKEDQQRREQLLPLMARASTADDLANIALVYQHGDCIEHYLLAHTLAKLSATKQHQLGTWLVAATIDRALMNSGKAQKYGTQYIPKDATGRCFALYVTDPRTTDAERIALHVPPLEEAIAQAKMFGPPDCR